MNFSPIVLTGEDAKNFRYQILHPDSEMIKRRDRFLAEASKIKIDLLSLDKILEEENNEE